MPKNRPKVLNRVYFTVKGRGVFPNDMLRYDQCVLAGLEDEHWAYGTLNRREALLVRYFLPKSGRHQENAVTVARWNSFGWQVTEVYPMETVPTDWAPPSVLEMLEISR